MSTINVACTCGRILKAPPQFAGKNGRCKGCGASVRIPNLPDEVTSPVAGFTPSDDSDLPPPSPPDDKALLAVAASIETDEEDEPDAPLLYRRSHSEPTVFPEEDSDEPWYYGFLVLYARWTMYLGLAACALIVVCGLLIVVNAFTRGVFDAPPVATGAIGSNTDDQFINNLQVSLARIELVRGVGVMIFGAFCLIPVLLASTPILLAVDAARNLRAIRLRGQ